MARVELSADELAEGVLPPICIVCGSNAPEPRMIRFTWAPAWTHLMLLVGFLTCVGIWPWLIIRILKHRSMVVHVSLCDRHRLYWVKRRLFLPVGVFSTLGVLLVVMFGLSDERGSPPDWALLFPFGLLVSILAGSAILQFRGTRVVEITQTRITFAEADPRFVTAVE